MGIPAITLGRTSRIVAGVRITVWIDSGRVVTAVRVKVQVRLELQLSLRSIFGQRRENITQGQPAGPGLCCA